jgi:hypothetical protein
MAAWVVIAVKDLEDYLVGAQLNALRTAALATGQADPFPNVMHDRCNYVRNRIASRVMLSATAYSVPPELKTAACWLVLEVMQGRLPALKLSDDQKRQIERAYKDLDIAGKEDLPISAADDAMTPTVQSGGGIERVSTTTRKATRDSLDGL